MRRLEIQFGPGLGSASLWLDLMILKLFSNLNDYVILQSTSLPNKKLNFIELRQVIVLQIP